MMTEKKMQLVDWLDDLSVRFIINLPKEELKSVERICFQVEEAQWFYEDFIRPLDPELPSLNLRNFCLCIFQHCPMLSEYSAYLHAQAFEEFLAYKTRVPVRGAIMLNDAMDQVVLVKGWKKGANWSFPRGKINKDEPDLDCAIREVYEETGYDIRAAGLVGDEKDMKSIEMSLREQHMRLYVFRGVPMDTYFEPRTRKEISKIQWWKLTDLPTQKKKHQQKDGKGEDLAINANKFYMVASFLGQLKKWISEQKKMDRKWQAGEKMDLPIVTDEEHQQPDMLYANGNLPDPSMDDGFGTLVNGLQQSAQPANKIELPKAADLSAQLSSILGVQPAQPNIAVTQSPASLPSTAGIINNPKANDLLALLQPNPSTQPTQQPQKPLEQVVRHPPQPRSPPHPHHQPPHLSKLPPRHAFPKTPIQYDTAMAQPQQLQPPQTRPISPPTQPAQLIPRSIHPVHHKISPVANVNQQTIAPYQRAGEPQLTRHDQALSGNINPSIPSASKLPGPNENPDSDDFINILKSGQPTQPWPHNSGSKVSLLPTAPSTHVVPATDSIPQSASSNDGTGRTPIQQKSRQSSSSAARFVPPQVSLNTSLAKADEVTKSKSEHTDQLLSLFRAPSKPGVERAKPRAANLQLPSAPVELSALPATPGHSREPSGKDTAARPIPHMLVHNGLVKIQKRPQPKPARSPNPPVSATINGPLNVPQFDMLAKAAKEQKHAMHNNHQPQPQKRSPITILARPGSSHASAAATEPEPATGSRSIKQVEATAPKVRTYATPVKAHPPTPNLKGQDLPAKPFHPQILRRPPQASNLNEPSPIQPLPSPKHSTLAGRRSSKPADHQKSLLSLFTKPSPVVSPPSAVPTGTIDTTVDSMNIISPLPPTPTPQEQADAAFARLSKNPGPLSHNEEIIPGPSKPTMLRMDSINGALAGGPKSRNDSGKQTPTSKKTTPTEHKPFLLEYLAGVK
ncbi:hypothetical protein N7G274_000135 [Stereocaulon virgatum]|uniref:Nudix hydrolase domain-containing protein n=1 Tax=Stereocaulon virgatum TaxID=373712 RepID=A0ABR4AR96_9LECA